MNNFEYWAIVILATFLTLLMEIGIPFIVIGLGTIFGFCEFSCIGVILIWIVEQTLFNIKGTTDMIFKIGGSNED